MKTFFKLIFAIISSRVYKDKHKIICERIEAHYQLEKLFKKVDD